MELDTFLPVPPDGYEPEAPTPNLQTKFRRGHDLAPEDVHHYCYRQVLDDF